MIDGFVDSASLYEVLLALSRSSPKDSFKLEWDRALEVTAVFISTDQLKLPPSPQFEGSASGTYGIMMSGLREIITQISISPDIITNSLENTKKWAQRNNKNIQACLDRFTGSNSDNLDVQSRLWLESHIENEWMEHAARRGSLFENTFFRQISDVINAPKSELERIHSLCSDQKFLLSLVKTQKNTTDFTLARNAFIVSTIFRGQYYKLIAKQTNRQILTNPIRDIKQNSTLNQNSIKIDVSNFERYMANIVLSSAFAEKSPNKRVALWVENISKMRNSRGRIMLNNRITDEIARDDAIHEAKRFGIRVHSKLVENGLDATINLGCNIMTTFFLSPFGIIAPLAGLTISGAMYVATKRWNIGEKIAETITLNTTNLRSISQSAPGCIGEQPLPSPDKAA